MYTLGINAVYHDSAACLVKDGVVIAAAEEERFSHIKHGKRPVPFSTWELPFNAIDYCLKEAGIALPDVDHVAYSYDVRLLDRYKDIDSLVLPMQPSAHGTADANTSPWEALFACYVTNAPRQLVGGVPLRLQQRLAGVDLATIVSRWHAVDHHLCHEASAFLAAPYRECAVLTMDGRGESATTTFRPPDLSDFAVRPIRKSDAVQSQEKGSRYG